MFKVSVFSLRSLSFFGLILLLPFSGNSQNLVPNPGFEENIGCPGPFVYLTNTKNWTSVANHSGTPDLFWKDCPYNGIGEKNLMAKNQLPYDGVGCIGLFTHGDKLREYCTVQLNKALEKGKTYKVEFYVRPANGYGTAINSFGLHFSKTEVKSENSGSLAFIPLEEHISNPSDRFLSDTSNWVSISGEYVSKGGEQYITLGNFKRDEETKSFVMKENCIRADRSYMLLDHVSVEAKNEKDKETVINSDSVVPIPDKIPTIIKDVFYARNSNVTISLWDHNIEDGDSIDLSMNDVVLLEKFRLTKKMHKIQITVTDSITILKVKALNLGRKPPNTVSIIVSDGTNSKRIILNSNLIKSEALKIVYTKTVEYEK